MTKLRVIGYVRVSTDKQEVGPEVQIEQLQVAADLHGWKLDLRREDAASAKSLDGRPVLAQALADLRAHRADVLAVAKLDRLSRSVADFARLLEDAQRERWHVVCLDLAVDTTTIAGRAMAQVTSVFAEMERRRIGERTRDGMARIKADTGKHMGRPAVLDPATVAVIMDLRSLGYSLREIARHLADTRTPTATGGQWWPSTVRAVIARVDPSLLESESERPLRSLAEASG